jgi:cytochrome c biogenesis protein CcdA
VQTLLTVLGSIALLDSTSMLPLAIPILIAFLAGPRPYLACIAFLAGVFAVYFPGGVILALGLDAIVDRLQPALDRYLTDPSLAHILLQIGIGAVMVAFAWKLADTREARGDRGAGEGMAPGAAFALGAGSMLVGLPGAVPYFAAIDQILRADLASPGTAGLLLYYNLVFLAPLAAIPLLRALAGDRGDGFLRRLAPRVERWGRRLVIGVLLVIGLVGVCDGIGLLLGHPLLPLPGVEPAGL